MILLAFENRNHFLAGFRRNDCAAFDLFQQLHHFARRADADAVTAAAAVGLFVPIGSKGFAFAAAPDFAQAARDFAAELFELFIHGIGGDVIQHQIGRRVVAEHNHQMHGIAQRQPQAVAEVRQNACAADFLFFREHEFIAPFDFASCDQGKGRRHNRHFDRTRRADTFVFADAVARARVQVFGKQRNLAFEGFDFGTDFFVEGFIRSLCQRWERKQQEEAKGFHKFSSSNGSTCIAPGEEPRKM